jgi:hypothetical protein
MKLTATCVPCALVIAMAAGGLAPPAFAEGAEAGEARPEAGAPLERTREPVTGAFGIPLGERFSPDLVVEVLREAEHSYRGADGDQRKGVRYWVEPKIPNPNFTVYSVSTTSDGTIYAIRGEHQTPDRASKCEVTETLAAFLAQKYGPPRGQGAAGEWYSFRDMSAPEAYKGIRLYATRCARGGYTIVYSDDRVRYAAP